MPQPFDPGSPVHLALVAAAVAAGLASCWIGVRDGLVRRRVRTNAGTWRGGRAVAVGLLYLATGLVGIGWALRFVLRGG